MKLAILIRAAGGLMALAIVVGWMAFAPGCSQVCGAVGCPTGARIHAALPSTDWQTIRSWHFTMCRNQTCLSDNFQRLGVQPPGFTDTSSFQSPDPAQLTAAVRPSISVWVNQSGRMETLWDDDFPSTPTTGDVYSLDVFDSSGATVTSFQKPVAYKRSAPNGEDCGPICYSADINSTP